MRKLGYWPLALVAVIATLGLVCPASATTVVLDNFQSSDISTWTDPVSPPFYTRVTWTSDGNASVGALQIQEGGEGTTSHTDSALARKIFASSQDWTAYQTLQLDAKIDTGSQNGYSIRVKNNGTYSWIHGFTPTTSYQTIKFDISGVARNQIEDIVIYVNRTGQDAGQILKIDNLLLDTASAGVPATRDIDNFDAAGYDPTAEGWSPGGTNPTVSIAAVTDGTSKALQIQQLTSASSAFALARKRPAINQDWTDYTTLEFDARFAQGTLAAPSSNGFSVLVYNAGTSITLRAFRPTTSYQTFQVDISGLERDQINEFLFYVNRTSQNNGQLLFIDDIRLTRNPVTPPPSLVNIDDFDSSTTLPANWDYSHASCSKGINSTYYVSQPNSAALQLIPPGSMAAYARKTFTYRPSTDPISAEPPTMDWGPYKSLIFEAKVIPESPARPPLDAGYLLNIVNGGSSSISGIANQKDLTFYPGTDWTTIKLDISGMTRDQVVALRFYINRCDKWFGLTTGQTLLIDNLRVSMEAAPAAQPPPPLVDDFESGIDTWWRFYSTSGLWYSGGTEGSHCLQITDTSQAGSSSAYLRKTFYADWSGYKTLVFDAMALNSLTTQGFTVSPRDYTGYQFGLGHPYAPTGSWHTFKMDISGDTRSEIIGMAYYVNRTSQSHGQQLFLDNIRLSADPAETVYGTVGAAKGNPDGTDVQIPDAVVTGYFPSATVDPVFGGTTLLNVFLIEDLDRAGGIPVILSPRTYSGSPAAPPTFSVGDKVTVTGFLGTANGQRYIYARAATLQSSGNALPEPIVCNGRSAGGSAAVGGAGLDNTGLLVTLVGQTSGGSYMPDGRYFVYLDDGSGVTADNGAVGVKVYVPAGEWLNPGVYLRVTGYLVNELDPATGNVIRALWARSMDYSEIPH